MNKPSDTMIVTGIDDWGNDTVLGKSWEDGSVKFFANNKGGYTPLEFGEHDEAVDAIEAAGFKYDGYSIRIRTDY